MQRGGWAVAGLIVLGTGLGGCHSMPERDPAYASVRPNAAALTPETNGSIYHAATNISLFEDLRARRVGDILIVRLVESTNASKSASTNTKKESSVEVLNPNLFGTGVLWDAPKRAPLAATTNLNLSANLDSGNEFKGDGGSTQKNTLSGNISVTVTEVLPNGNLIIRGEKIIGINQGSESVRLSGMVRAQDILSDNTVLSTQVADASISYGGQGALADSNSQGWAARFFNSGWWPF